MGVTIFSKEARFLRDKEREKRLTPDEMAKFLGIKPDVYKRLRGMSDWVGIAKKTIEKLDNAFPEFGFCGNKDFCEQSLYLQKYELDNGLSATQMAQLTGISRSNYLRLKQRVCWAGVTYYMQDKLTDFFGMSEFWLARPIVRVHSKESGNHSGNERLKASNWDAPLPDNTVNAIKCGKCGHHYRNYCKKNGNIRLSDEVACAGFV